MITGAYRLLYFLFFCLEERDKKSRPICRAGRGGSGPQGMSREAGFPEQREKGPAQRLRPPKTGHHPKELSSPATWPAAKKPQKRKAERERADAAMPGAQDGPTAGSRAPCGQHIQTNAFRYEVNPITQKQSTARCDASHTIVFKS